jgi:hypothetical protein
MEVDKTKMLNKMSLIEQFVSRPTVAETENGKAILAGIVEDRNFIDSSTDQVSSSRKRIPFHSFR